MCEALGADHDLLNAAVGPGLLEVERDALTAVQMDPSVVYMDVTSYASGEPDLLPVAMTGQSGRRITQINDVHDNLDLLYALRLLVNRTDDVGMLLRAALIVEVYSLIELAIGPPRGEKPARDGASLVDFVDRQRGEEGYAQLEEIRTRVVPEEHTQTCSPCASVLPLIWTTRWPMPRLWRRCCPSQSTICFSLPIKCSTLSMLLLVRMWISAIWCSDIRRSSRLHRSTSERPRRPSWPTITRGFWTSRSAASLEPGSDQKGRRPL